MKDLSKYAEILLKSKFPQSYLLNSNDFVRFIESIGLNLNIKDLEFYDKVGIMEPILKLRRPKVREIIPKYEMISSDIFSSKNYYKDGFIELIKDDYEPWETYKDEMEDTVILYYHPFQFLPLRRLTMGLDIVLKPGYFENVKDFQISLQSIKERVTKHIESSKKSYQLFWIPRIGLLILLDEVYGPLVKPFKVNIYSDRNSYPRKWNEWRQNQSIPREILKVSGLSIEEIKEWYDGIAT
jgi:hypothetical protein